VHRSGGRIFLQLWHVGRISHPSLQPEGALPVAPSAIAARGEAFTAIGPQPFIVPRALATDEIAGVIAQFEDGARRALAAGFDGVEIHGANGYLIDQFLRDGSNRRTDRYGGSVLNRARFLLEVTEAVAGVWGAGRVGVRLSPWSEFNDMRDSDPRTTFGYAARALAPLELAYLHLLEPVGGLPAGETPLAPELKAAFRGPLMVNGGYTRALAEAALARGEADLVSFAASFLANPDLPARLARNAPLNTPDPATFYGGDHRGYTDYPALDAALAA
jgi:N-ethylmaleimide reductase